MVAMEARATRHKLTCLRRPLAFGPSVSVFPPQVGRHPVPFKSMAASASKYGLRSSYEQRTSQWQSLVAVSRLSCGDDCPDVSARASTAGAPLIGSEWQAGAPMDSSKSPHGFSLLSQWLPAVGVECLRWFCFAVAVGQRAGQRATRCFRTCEGCMAAANLLIYRLSRSWLRQGLPGSPQAPAGVAPKPCDPPPPATL